MNNSQSRKKDIIQRFDDKIDELRETLPATGRSFGNSCAAHTLNNILDVLDSEEFNKCYYNNLAIPFSGFGSYINSKGWKGPCGVVSGAIAAIGIIMGGKEQTNPKYVPLVFTKAIQFAYKFEEEFGSVSCHDLCGLDLTKDYQKYKEEHIWEDTCVNFVYFA
ncbi:MAG: C_GCAxxG_C_C family protein, partial [Promethearchaeota archaeon]